MRRRILVAILATVTLALVLSGLGTYLLLRREAVRTSEAALRSEVASIAGLVTAAGQTNAPRVNQQRLVTGLRLEGIGVLVRQGNGTVRGSVPEGLPEDLVDPAALAPGAIASGRVGELTWAATTVDAAGEALATVVITRETQRPSAPVGWYFLAGGVALAVGAAVAVGLSDTLTRPLRRARLATARIAEGDLSELLPDPPPQAHDEVADLTRSLNAMAIALAHSRRVERQFLLSVSHDLRTPLTSIRGYADAIHDGTAPDPAAAARVISTESQRLGRLVGDLLDLARLDANSFSFHLEAVPVGEVVVETVEGFRPTAEAAGVALTCLEPSSGALAAIDPDRLGQAVANLLENACKYAAGSVTVSTTASPGTVAIEVVDDGPGLAPADLPHVFERLYVTDRRPRRQVGGSGLGLAIVRELVSGMGGSVQVGSPALADGRGARFTIVLPQAGGSGTGASTAGVPSTTAGVASPTSTERGT